MNVTISSLRLKEYLKSKHNLDLTHRIQKIANWLDLPSEFEEIIRYDSLTYFLEKYGDLYYFKGRKRGYLVYKINNKWFCIDSRASSFPLSEVYEDVRIPEYLALNPDELYDIYGKD